MRRFRAGLSGKWTVVAAAFALAGAPATARAHLVTTGLGPLYDGIGHFALSPDDWISVLCLGLLAGLRGPAAGRRALFTLPPAWFIGGLFGLWFPPQADLPWGGITLLVLGVLTAADMPLNLAAITAISAALGLLHGWLNGAALAGSASPWLGLLGIAAFCFVAITLASGFVVSLKPAWTRIAVRVAGSWVGAIGLLLIGWAFRARR